MPYATDALSGKDILVSEDEWFLADAITASIQSAGGAVHGPFASVQETLEWLAGCERQPDAAALNIRLQDGDSYPIADELTRHGVPFVFASANDAASLPSRFARAPLVGKPYAAYQVVKALATLVEHA